MHVLKIKNGIIKCKKHMIKLAIHTLPCYFNYLNFMPEEFNMSCLHMKHSLKHFLWLTFNRGREKYFSNTQLWLVSKYS